MARSDERSLSDLRQGAERTRAEFADTTDKLRSKLADTVTDFQDRISPAAIKAQMGAYVSTRADALLDKARRNPLQAAAIGIGLAYPLMGVVRSIPAPVLMIGAGLYLLGSNAGQNAVRKVAVAATGVPDKIADGARTLSATVHAAEDGLVSAGRQVSSKIATRTEQLSPSQSDDRFEDGTQRTAFSGTSAAGALAELQTKASDSIDAASRATQAGVAAANTAVQDAVETVRAIGADAGQNAADGYQRIANVAVEATRTNPLLTGGIAFALGGLIASALPRSDLESGVMGDVSAGAAKRANDVLSKGFDAAKGVAVSVYEDVAQKVEEEGLTSRDLQNAGEEIGRRVRKVAQAATSASFDEPSGDREPTDAAQGARRAL